MGFRCGASRGGFEFVFISTYTHITEFFHLAPLSDTLPVLTHSAFYKHAKDSSHGSGRPHQVCFHALQVVIYTNCLPHRRKFKLNTGDEIPAIGLGTWQSRPGEVEKAVEAALRAGYRHIDTAFGYANEKEVGEGIRASGVPRSEIWLTTKLDNPWHKRVAEGIDRSLANLGTDYVDLYLIHWPSSTDPNDSKKHEPDWDFVDTWREMQKLVGTSKVRNIGVSNFGIKNLERLLNDPSCKVSCSSRESKPTPV